MILFSFARGWWWHYADISIAPLLSSFSHYADISLLFRLRRLFSSYFSFISLLAIDYLFFFSLAALARCSFSMLLPRTTRRCLPDAFRAAADARRRHYRCHERQFAIFAIIFRHIDVTTLSFRHFIIAWAAASPIQEKEKEERKKRKKEKKKKKRKREKKKWRCAKLILILPCHWCHYFDAAGCLLIIFDCWYCFHADAIIFSLPLFHITFAFAFDILIDFDAAIDAFISLFTSFRFSFIFIIFDISFHAITESSFIVFAEPRRHDSFHFLSAASAYFFHAEPLRHWLAMPFHYYIFIFSPRQTLSSLTLHYFRAWWATIFIDWL